MPVTFTDFFSETHGKADAGNAFVKIFELAGAKIHKYKYVYMEDCYNNDEDGTGKKTMHFVMNVTYGNKSGWVYLNFGMFCPCCFPLDFVCMLTSSPNDEMKKRYDVDNNNIDEIYAKFFVNIVLFDEFYESLKKMGHLPKDCFSDMLLNPKKYEQIYETILDTDIVFQPRTNHSCDICDKDIGDESMYSVTNREDFDVCEKCYQNGYDGKENDTFKFFELQHGKVYDFSLFKSEEVIINELFEELKKDYMSDYENGKRLFSLIKFMHESCNRNIDPNIISQIPEEYMN